MSNENCLIFHSFFNSECQEECTLFFSIRQNASESKRDEEENAVSLFSVAEREGEQKKGRFFFSFSDISRKDQA